MPLTHYSKFSMFTLRIWVFKSSVLKKLFILSKHDTKANIRSTKMTTNRYAYNRNVLQSNRTSDGLPLYCSQPTGEKTHTNQQCERLAKIRQTTVTSDRGDRELQRLVRRMPFATSPVLEQHWLPNRRLSTRTVRNRLKSAGLLKVKESHYTCNRRPDEGLETQKYSLYHKEHPANCPLRWRLSNGLGYTSHDCKLDLVTIQGNLTGDQYIRDVLQPVVVPHLDNRSLATRPVYMDDNARPHRSRAVTTYLQSEAVTSVPWPAMSPDLNPIEDIWDMLGRRIQALEHPVQNIRQLEAALHREWQQLSQQDTRRLSGGMRRRVEAVIQARGSYTRY
jgi:hypothetical protein